MWKKQRHVHARTSTRRRRSRLNFEWWQNGAPEEMKLGTAMSLWVLYNSMMMSRSQANAIGCFTLESGPG
jgi:hypothetical protein